MKNKILFGLFLTAVFATIGLSFKASAPDQIKVVNFGENETAVYAGTMPIYYEKTYAKDTISNALNDTLYLPSNMRPVLSDFLQNWAITRTNISGTTNVAVKVEQTNYAYSGTTPPTAGWVTATNNVGTSAATAATTATTEAISIPNSYGINYRVIVDGTGSQSTSYVIRVTLKKKG